MACRPRDSKPATLAAMESGSAIITVDKPDSHDSKSLPVGDGNSHSTMVGSRGRARCGREVAVTSTIGRGDQLLSPSFVLNRLGLHSEWPQWYSYVPWIR